MHIGIVKTSSMGDVIHALPVVSDLKRAHPQARIDWIVESSFAEIPAWHPGVERVVPVSIRRWRRSLTDRRTWAEFGEFRRQLQLTPRYDLVLDLQGLYKSVAVALLMNGPRAGFSWRCAREPLASLAYQQRFPVDMTRHAIERLRELAGRALGYPVEGLPHFEFAFERAAPADAAGAVVLLHATSRAEKLWPLEHWRTLVGELNRRGIKTLLPWASPAERAQALAIAEGSALNRVPESIMTLTECALRLSQARGVVGVDTGLTHLAAALGGATVSLFGATEAWRFGPYWSERAVNLGKPGVWPTPAEVLDALAPALGNDPRPASGPARR